MTGTMSWTPEKRAGLVLASALHIAALMALFLIQPGFSVSRDRPALKVDLIAVPPPPPEIQPPPPQPARRAAESAPRPASAPPERMERTPVIMPAPPRPPQPQMAPQPAAAEPAAGASAGAGAGEVSGAGSGAGAGGSLRAEWIERPAYFYPRRAARARITGRVTLSCRIDEANTPRSCRLISETPAGYRFGAETLAAARNFRVRPPVVDGRPRYDIMIQIPVIFHDPQPNRERVGPRGLRLRGSR